MLTQETLDAIVTNYPKTLVHGAGVRFSARNDTGEEVGRGYLYVLHNDLHSEPFGFMEDIYVSETERGGGIGTKIVDDIMTTAKALGCYKIVATSRHERPRVHALYERIGFENYGVEFRMNLH